MNIKELKQALPYIFKAGLVPNLIGLHGTGKSAVLRQIAKEMEYSFFPIFAGQVSDQGEIIGLPEFVRDGSGNATDTRFIHPTLLPKKPKSILFIDELGQVNKDVRGMLFQLVLEGNMLDYQLPEDSYVATAMNPGTEDYDGNDIFTNKAFGDRFVHIIFSPTQEEFLEYMQSKHGKTDFIDFLRNHREFIEDASLISPDLSFVKPSRRSGDRLQTLENTGIPKALFIECMMGIMGREAAVAYRSHLESVALIPRFDDVVTRGSKVLDPFFIEGEMSRTDVIATTCGDIVATLVKNDADLTPEQCKNLLDYLLVIPVENSISFMTEVKNKKPHQFLQTNFRKYICESDKLLAIIKETRETVKKA
jgi:hypothetical protein